MFKGRHFDRSVILLCVRWYLAYSLSLRDLEEMMAERGVSVDHATIHRWTLRYAPELLERFNRRKRAVTGRWHIDETYVKVRGQWRYLYRAIDSNGDTVEFWLSERRNLAAAKRFLRKALERHGRPERMVIDGSQTNREAILSCDTADRLRDRSRRTLGNKKPDTGDALYLALEDNGRRLQSRLDKLLPGVSKWPDRVTLVTKWRRLNEGGIDDLRDWIKGADNPRLIVIDTLKMVRSPQKRNAQLYDTDYEALQPLRDLANEHGLAIVVLHHARKAEAEDPIDLISGSGGLAAAANTILVITGTAQGTTLHVRGHDVEEADLAVEFNKQTCKWSILGGAAEVRQSDERKRVLAILTEEAEPLTPTEVAKITGKSRKTIHVLLQRLQRDGYIEKAKARRGAYVLAEKPPINGNSFRAYWQDRDEEASDAEH